MSVEQTDPIALLRTKAANLSTQLDTVRTTASFNRVTDSLADIDSQLSALPGRLAQARTLGYIFKSYLETDLEVIRSDWQSTRPRVQIDADYQRRLLGGQVDDLQMRFAQARALIDTDPGQADAALSAVAASAESLEKSANTTISTLQGMYNDLQSRLNTVQAQLLKIEKTLKEVDQACFKLYPEENIVDAIEAQWLTDQKGGPKGTLFCTDHRLLFEQNEDVATKRVLFIVTEKQRVQQLALEAPIGAVEQVKESESGALLFRRDHLELVFGAGSKVRSAHFILKGDSAAWQQLINSITSGQLDKERVQKEAAPVAEAPKAIPSQCSACGARFTQTLVRGMQSVKCQYCGTVTAL